MENDLIPRYKAAAIAHGEGSRTGDSSMTNKAYDLINELLLRITGSSSDKALFDLYVDEDLWVQLWSASHTLEIDEDRALAKLQSIADEEVPIASMTARYTIQEWKDGVLRFRKNGRFNQS